MSAATESEDRSSGLAPAVGRPRLAARVRKALEAGSVMLVAGGGYGKTTLLEQVVEETADPVAWLTCSDADRAPGRLLASVLDALGRVVPGIGDPLLERVSVGERLDPGGAGRWLVRELDTLLVEPVVLVLDEAERLADVPEALRIVDALLSGEGPLRIAVATRRPLALEAAATSVLGEPELAFDADDCAAFLTARLGSQPSPGELRHVLETSLGWPLGVALGLPAGESLAGFIDERVLEQVPDELRDALLDSAVVDELSPALLAALGLPADLPARAAAHGLPMRAVAGRPGVVAHHPLVREHLRGRLEEERAPEAHRALLERAAAPLAAEGRRVEAIEAWLGACAWDRALGAVAGDLLVLLATAPDTVRAWLARLPDEVRDQPVARLLAGRLAYAEGDHAAAAAEMRQADAGLAALGAIEARLGARLVLGESLFWLGGLDELAHLADDIDPPSGDATSPLRAVVLAWSMQGMAVLGDVERAVRTMERIRRGAPELGHMHEATHAAIVAFASGTGDRALELLDARLRAVRSGRPYERPELDIALAALLLADQGRTDEALERANRLVEGAEASEARPFMRAVAYVLRAWLLASAGRGEEAELALAPLGHPASELWPIAFVDATRAMAAGARGRAAEAASCVDRALDGAARAPLAYRTLLVLAVVPVMARAGRDGRALAVVEATLAELDERLPGARGAYHRARLLVVRAWLRHRAGDDAAAGADVTDALASAGPSAPHLVRAGWGVLGDLSGPLLEQGLVDADVLLDALEVAMPASEAMLGLSEHPVAAVRARVLAAVAASGRPDASARIAAMAGDPDEQVAAAARRLLERARVEPPPRSFTLLGGFRLQLGEYVVDDKGWERPMAQRLVRYLLVHRGRLIPEELILEALWPGRPLRSARSSLQVTVSRARAVLDPAGSDGSVLDYAERAYRLDLDERDRVDVDAFELAATTALASAGPARRAMLEQALTWWTGEPLPEERYADWTRDWRERLVRRYTAVLGALLELHMDAGDHAAAIEVAHRSLDVDPLDERTQRVLMVAYARHGRRGRALRQFLECRRALVDALGIEPSVETVAVQQRLLAGEPV